MEGAAELVEDEGNSGLEGRSIMCASVHLAGRYASLGAANGLAFARTAASMLRQTTGLKTGRCDRRQQSRTGTHRSHLLVTGVAEVPSIP